MKFAPPASAELRSFCLPGRTCAEDLIAAARWGFDQAVAQIPTWPEPITDRRPTEADADEWGEVMFFRAPNATGMPGWNVTTWKEVRDRDYPWLHTPSWRPRQDPRQQALADLATLSGSPEAIERIRRVLEGEA